MIIRLNGAPHEVEPGTTIGILLVAVTGSTRGSAAVVAGAVVPRSQWDTTTLNADDAVELITAVQGG